MNVVNTATDTTTTTNNNNNNTNNNSDEQQTLISFKREQQQQQQQQQHQKQQHNQQQHSMNVVNMKLMPNPVDVAKASVIASERLRKDCKDALDLIVSSTMKPTTTTTSEPSSSTSNNSIIKFKTAEDVLKALMPFHCFADPRQVFNEFGLLNDNTTANTNQNVNEKNARLREAVGYLLQETTTNKKNDRDEDLTEEEKQKYQEQNQQNQNELTKIDEHKLKRQRLNDAYALLTDENILHSGVAMQMNKVSDETLKQFKLIYSRIEACEKSCAPLERHTDEEGFLKKTEVFTKSEELLIERLIFEETRVRLDIKSKELRNLQQEERQKLSDVRKAEANLNLLQSSNLSEQQQQQQQQQQQMTK
jgi:hypothetical protein